MASKQYYASVVFALFVLSIVLAPTLLSEAARISPQGFKGREKIQTLNCPPCVEPKAEIWKCKCPLCVEPEVETWECRCPPCVEPDAETGECKVCT